MIQKIQKTITTEHGDVNSTAEVLLTDSGQVVLHVTSTLGAAKHEHRVTVGAEDGNDAVASMTDADLQASLQTHLDKVRSDAANVLSARAKVAKLVSSLS
jgi:hypothetical protein